MTPFKQFPLALPEPPPHDLSVALQQMQMKEEKSLMDRLSAIDVGRIDAWINHVMHANGKR